MACRYAVIPGARDSEGRLFVTTAAPAATDPRLGGLALTNDGELYIVEVVPPAVDLVVHPLSGSGSGAWSLGADEVLRDGDGGTTLVSTTFSPSPVPAGVYHLEFDVSNFSGDSFSCMLSGGANVGAVSGDGPQSITITSGGTGNGSLDFISWAGTPGTATISNIHLYAGAFMFAPLFLSGYGYPNGFTVNDVGQLYCKENVPITSWLGGLPFADDGALVISLADPVASDPYVGGIRVSPTLGVYVVLDTPPPPPNGFSNGFSNGFGA